MRMDDRPISPSRETVALEPDNGGTRLTYTEKGAVFDGLDGVASRQDGWTWLLGEMEKAMAATGAVQSDAGAMAQRLRRAGPGSGFLRRVRLRQRHRDERDLVARRGGLGRRGAWVDRRGRGSEEHTYDIQSLMRNSYAVLC